MIRHVGTTAMRAGEAAWLSCMIMLLTSIPGIAHPPPSSPETVGVMGMIVDSRLAVADAAANGRLVQDLPAHALIMCIWQTGQCNPPDLIDAGESADQIRRDVEQRLAAAGSGSANEPPTLRELSEVLDSLYRKAEVWLRDRRRSQGGGNAAEARLQVRIIARPDVKGADIAGPDLTKATPSQACLVPAGRAGGAFIGIRSVPPGFAGVDVFVELDGRRGWGQSVVQTIASLASSDPGRLAFLGQAAIGCAPGPPVSIAARPAAGEDCRGEIVNEDDRPTLSCASRPGAQASQSERPQPRAAESPVARPPPAGLAGLQTPPAAGAAPLFCGSIVTTPLPGTAGGADQVVWRDTGSNLNVAIRAIIAGKTFGQGRRLDLTGAPAGIYRIELVMEARPGACSEAAVLAGSAEERGPRIGGAVDLAVNGTVLICPGDPPLALAVGEVTVR